LQGGALVSDSAACERKQFFFEKKNQKTFAILSARTGQIWANVQKFFGAFF
jgi:hypothetical protein